VERDIYRALPRGNLTFRLGLREPTRRERWEGKREREREREGSGRVYRILRRVVVRHVRVLEGTCDDECGDAGREGGG